MALQRTGSRVQREDLHPLRCSWSLEVLECGEQSGCLERLGGLTALRAKAPDAAGVWHTVQAGRRVRPSYFYFPIFDTVLQFLFHARR